jgi:UDP-N-acetylmuramate dehydrogenase
MNWWKSLRGKVKLNEPLKKHTTFKIGGPARYFIEPKDIDDLKSLLILTKRYNIPFLVMGRGSNILVSDKGIDSAVIRLSSPFFKKISFKNSLLDVGCGIDLSKLIRFAEKHDLAGLEFLAGIPGTLGGALSMNAGAWGKNIHDVVREVTVMDYNGKIKILKRSALRFSYRYSNLSKYLILNARLKVNRCDNHRIKERILGYLLKRRLTQDLSKPSAGCIFKNPKEKFAGKLIELCGLKGKSIKDATISGKHANFILNSGNAHFSDVLRLMNLIKRRVKQRFDINLEPEIKIWQ